MLIVLWINKSRQTKHFISISFPVIKFAELEETKQVETWLGGNHHYCVTAYFHWRSVKDYCCGDIFPLGKHGIKAVLTTTLSMGGRDIVTHGRGLGPSQTWPFSPFSGVPFSFYYIKFSLQCTISAGQTLWPHFRTLWPQVWGRGLKVWLSNLLVGRCPSAKFKPCGSNGVSAYTGLICTNADSYLYYIDVGYGYGSIGKTLFGCRDTWLARDCDDAFTIWLHVSSDVSSDADKQRGSIWVFSNETKQIF